MTQANVVMRPSSPPQSSSQATQVTYAGGNEAALRTGGNGTTLGFGMFGTIADYQEKRLEQVVTDYHPPRSLRRRPPLPG